MISFLKKLKAINKNKRLARRQAGMAHSIKAQGHPEYSRGMTYVELIVVLSIFAVMSSIVVFNYGDFQAKVDIKNLASDIALKIVEAQKSALSGKLTTVAFPSSSKPSYGVYFNIAGDNKSFIYFADLDNDHIYNEPPLETISIQKGNTIEAIETCTGSTTVTCVTTPTPLAITFVRPNSQAFFYSDNPNSGITTLNYIKITIQSPKSSKSKALIKIYPSGRIQVN